MFVILRKGYGADFEPQLRCAVCQKKLPLHESWLAFHALSEEAPEAEASWVHKPCLDGRAQGVLRSARVTLWRGVDLLTRLLHTEA